MGRLETEERKELTMTEWDLFLGCDPGSSGCISAIDRLGVYRVDIRMDQTLVDLADDIEQINKRAVFAVIEKVHSMPKQGVSSSFKFGDAFGLMRGMITMSGIRHEYVTPQSWQKAMKCMTKGDKNVSKRAAQQLFPGVKVTHRNADSLLMAEYARRLALERGW